MSANAEPNPNDPNPSPDDPYPAPTHTPPAPEEPPEEPAGIPPAPSDIPPAEEPLQIPPDGPDEIAPQPPNLMSYARYVAFAAMVIAAAVWIASPEPPPVGYASTAGLIIR
jgi:hypothetical protein